MEILTAGVPPAYYNYANAATAITDPSTMHVKDTAVAAYYRRYLLKRIFSVFDWTLPEEWDKDYFLYSLYCSGFVAVLKSAQFGTICQHCTLSGYNVYYRPTTALIANPLFKTPVELAINKDCALIKLQPDYSGVLDIVDYYACKLALISQALNMNLVNSKLAYALVARDKASAESLKRIFDTVQSGNPAVAFDSKLMTAEGNPTWREYSNNLKSNYIASDLLADMRAILNDFDSMVGIPNANTSKRERLISDEVNANNAETATLCEVWLDTLKKGVETANKMFNLNISVDWRWKPDVESYDDPARTGDDKPGDMD